MTTGITITNEKGEHLTTDKHGAMTWTPDADQAIHLCTEEDAALLSRANAAFQQIQQHRGIATHTRGAPASPVRQKAATRAQQILREMQTVYGVPEALVEELREQDRAFHGRSK